MCRIPVIVQAGVAGRVARAEDISGPFSLCSWVIEVREREKEPDARVRVRAGGRAVRPVQGIFRADDTVAGRGGGGWPDTRRAGGAGRRAGAGAGAAAVPGSPGPAGGA